MLGTILLIILVLIIAGVILWGLQHFPVDPTLFQIIRVLVIVVCVIVVAILIYDLITGALGARGSLRLR